MTRTSASLRRVPPGSEAALDRAGNSGKAAGWFAMGEGVTRRRTMFREGESDRIPGAVMREVLDVSPRDFTVDSSEAVEASYRDMKLTGSVPQSFYNDRQKPGPVR